MGRAYQRRRARHSRRHRTEHVVSGGVGRRCGAAHQGTRAAGSGRWRVPRAGLCCPRLHVDAQPDGGWPARPDPSERSPAHRGDRRYRLSAERQSHPGLQRSGQMAVRHDRAPGRGAPPRPCDPRRRLPLPRVALPGGSARLCRKPVRRQLGGLAEGFLLTRRTVAGRSALGPRPWQPRAVQPRRPWLVSIARSPRRRGGMHRDNVALRAASRSAEPSGVRRRRRGRRRRRPGKGCAVPRPIAGVAGGHAGACLAD